MIQPNTHNPALVESAGCNKLASFDGYPFSIHYSRVVIQVLCAAKVPLPRVPPKGIDFAYNKL